MACQIFCKLPRQPYSVEPVPAHLAPTYTADDIQEPLLGAKERDIIG